MDAFRTTASRLATLFGLALLIPACDESDGPAGLSDRTAVTVLLTDAPGDVAHAWVVVREIYLQGGGDEDEENTAGGRTILFAGPSEPIDLVQLSDAAVEIGAALVPARRYGQLRVVLDGAAVEIEGEGVFATEGFDPPGSTTLAGELVCPSCDTSGFKVLLQGRDLDLLDPEELLVLDFDVSDSFLRQAGMSGRWIVSPVIKLFGAATDAD